MSTHTAPESPAAPIQSTSTFNIQNLVTPSLSIRDTPVDISRLLYMLYQDVEHQITRADMKAQITLGTSTVLAGFSANLGLGLNSGGSGATMIEWVVLALYGFCFVGLFAAIGFAVTAAFPRSLGLRRAPGDECNLYFSADIIQLPTAEYVSRFLGQSNEQLKEGVIRQVQIKSRVLERKLVFVRAAFRSMVLAILSWALAHLILLIAFGRLAKVG